MDGYLDNYLETFTEGYKSPKDVDSQDKEESYAARRELRSAALAPPKKYEMKVLTPEEANSIMARQQIPASQSSGGNQGGGDVFNQDMVNNVRMVGSTANLVRKGVKAYGETDLPGSEGAAKSLETGSNLRTGLDTLGGGINMFMGARNLVDGSGDQRVGGATQLAAGASQAFPRTVGSQVVGDTTFGKVAGKAAQAYTIYTSGKGITDALNSDNKAEVIPHAIRAVTNLASPEVGLFMGLAETAVGLDIKNKTNYNIEIPSITSRGAFTVPEWDKPVANYEINQQIRDNKIIFDELGIANKPVKLGQTWNLDSGSDYSAPSHEDHGAESRKVEKEVYLRVDEDKNLIISETPFDRSSIKTDKDLSGKHFIQPNADITINKYRGSGAIGKEYENIEDFDKEMSNYMADKVASGGAWDPENARYGKAFEPIAQAAEQTISGLQNETKSWLETLPPEKRAEAEMELDELEITYADPHSKGHSTISTKRAGSFQDDTKIFLSRLVVDYVSAVYPIMQKYGVE